MKILVACEESQVVCKAFRDKGHEAFSCDILATSGNNPEWHLRRNVEKILYPGEMTNIIWDMIIAHPPCDYLTVSNNNAMANGCSKYTAEQGLKLRQNAIRFFLLFAHHTCPRIAIENPIGIMSTVYKNPSQIIQPWQFGHPESKATCLWLKGLPLLKHTEYAYFKNYRCKCGNIFPAEYGKYGCCENAAKPLWDNQTKSGQNNLPPSADRAKLRSKTYAGIAAAMADQWS